MGFFGIRTTNGAGNGNGNGLDNQRLQHLYAEQLADIRAAEKQASAVFPDMAVVATDEDVASIFRAAAAETEIQLVRLTRLMESLDFANGAAVSPALAGYLSEVRTVLDGEFDGNGTDLDATLLGAVRRSLRYQIAGYESVCATARRLGDYASLDVLLQSLDEELATDSSLSHFVSRRSRLLRAI